MSLHACMGGYRAQAHARAVAALVALCPLGALGQLVTLSPTSALAATGTARAHATAPTFPVPASARPQRAGDTSQAAGTSVVPANTVPHTTTAAAVPTTPVRSAGAPTATAPSASVPTATAPSAAASRAGFIPGAVTRNGALPAHRASAHSTKLSTGALIAAALAAVAVLLCAAWALVRWLALEPRWTRSVVYSMEEVGFRASATWSEFIDWASLGR